MIIPTHINRRDARHAFEIALDEAAAEIGVGVDDALHAAASAIALSDMPSYVAVSSLVAAYRASAAAAPKRETPPPPPQRETPPPPRPLPRQAAAEFVRVLRPGLTAAELGRLRRRFALEHHPDRVPPALRTEAAEAMALVNAQVDRAVKRATGREQ